MTSLSPIWAFWQFGSLGMLAWGSAAVIPFVLHFWSRRRYREEPWAAMAFLLAAVRKSARRIQLEQWLLLVVRSAMLLLFAAALADPRSSVGGGSAGIADGPAARHLVLVLDGSYSMDARSRGAARFQAAKDRARQLVADGGAGDGFSLVVMGEPSRTIIGPPTFDRAAVLHEIDELELVHAGASLSTALAEIEAVLRQASEQAPRARGHVYFLTDLQQATWGEATSAESRARFARLTQRAAVELIDVGEESGENLAVVQLRLDQPLAAAHADVTIEADIQNFARTGQPRQPVEVLVDGVRIADERIDVPALGQASVRVPHRFRSAGEHVVEVRLSDDALPLDNRRWLSVPVRETIRVLCVGGSPGETRHLALALAPEPGGQIEVVEAPESRLAEEDLARYDAVFLCNIGRFSQSEANLLARYCQSGGGVVLFLGDQVQAANYNELLGGDGEASLLPARLGTKAAAGKYAFDPLEYVHPIVAPFRGFERAGLLTTPIWSYVRATPARGATTALAYSNGDPAIIERAVGHGRSILVTTAASPRSADQTTSPPTPWNALSAWPSFPPLVHEILRFAVSGRAEQRNVLVGNPLTAAIQGATGDSQFVEIVGPNLARQRVAVPTAGGAARFSYDETTASGIYEVAAGGQTRKFAVNLNCRESNLERVEGERLGQLFAQLPSAAADTSWPTASKPTEYFRWFLGAVLGLLVAEPCLAWLLGRRRA